ncbi:hypothetical protein F5882DRAFT_386908 [Hyaloscypha sp. PMI_1271]|nr:hypothetical protein F5882DRAFT_386908 [Hyaloscypha sp. PMI_1271]
MVSPEDSEHHEDEIRDVIAAIDNHAGPQSLIVLAVVSKEVILQVKSRCSNASANIEITTEENLQTAISSLATKFSGKRLALIISKSHCFVTLRVSADFTSLDVISASQNKIHLESESTYCSVPLTAWSRRVSYRDHELIVRPHVYLEVADYEFPSTDIPPPFKLADEEDAPTAAKNNKTMMEYSTTMQISSKQSNVLPWLAGAVGVGASVATGVSIVSNFEFGIWGAYVSCGPLVAAAGNAVGTGSLVMAGAATLGIGAAAAAAVYFIPWRKLAKWAAKAWDLFFIFVKSVWKFFKIAWNWFVSFLKLLIKAMKDFITHVANAVSWTGRALFSTMFGNSNSAGKGAFKSM